MRSLNYEQTARYLEADFHKARAQLTPSQRQYLDAGAVPRALMFDPAMKEALATQQALDAHYALRSA
jgi:hypothetical protein